MGYPNPNESEILTIRGYFDLCLCCDEGYDDASCTCTYYTPKDVIEAAESLRQALADAEREKRELASDLKFLFDKYGWDLAGYDDKEVVARLRDKAALILGKKGGE
jgi:hypothetical protein